MNSEITNEKNKPRNPILAFLFSLFFYGFGQVYNGQIKKGIIFLLIELTLPFIFGFTRLGVFFIGFISILIIGFAFRIYVIYDATKTAKKLKIYKLKSYNTWYYHLAIIIGISTILWLYDSNTANSIMGVRSYIIPTTSNEPNIKLGDRLIADSKAYDQRKPNYGDLVVFQKKDSLKSSMYRIVALPNDKIEIQNNFLIINGKKCRTSFVKETKNGGLDVNEYEEQLPNGHKHKIYTFKKPFEENKRKIPEMTIPANCYYLLGDNRDNAMDSRYVGIINKDEIKGEIVFSYWGKTTDRINIDFRDK